MNLGDRARGVIVGAAVGDALGMPLEFGPPRRGAQRNRLREGNPAQHLTKENNPMPYMPDDRPNLLYIHSDQHNPFVTGCYGDPVVQTPNLDRLAARGVLFENAYCPSPICVPSRMSMLTGRHPYENDCWTNDHSLDSGIPTLAHAMGAAGYWPVLIGRMHSRGPDQLHGYAERLVGDHSANYIGGTPGVDHGMLTGTQGPARISLQLSGIGQNAYEVHDEYTTAAAIYYLNQLGIARRSNVPTEPFSLSIGFMLPHQPFVARRKDYERYEGRVPPPDHPEPWGDHLHPYHRWWRERCGITDVTDEEVMRCRTAYWALVDRVDAMVGEILEALERNGLAENTLIVYSSDHGEQVGEHGLWWKQTFYEEAVRVPMILCWPGHLPEGLRCNRVVSALDLNATILDALGAPALPASHGRSLLPLIRGETNDWYDIAFSEYCTDEGCIHRMVRRGDWKLNYYHGQPPQLFNLREDPTEMHDRAADPGCQAIREELTALVLDGWNPDAVWKRIQEKRADGEILHAWARRVKPPETYRWPLRPEMDYLEQV